MKYIILPNLVFFPTMKSNLLCTLKYFTRINFLLSMALTLFLLAFFNHRAQAQCPNDNSQFGSSTVTCGIAPVTLTTCIYGGEYRLVTGIIAGNTYEFRTCGDTDFDTQITLYNDAGGAFLAYNDDYCGAQSQITWIATFSGSLRVLVDQYNCVSNTTCMTLVASCTSPANPCAAPIESITCESSKTVTLSGSGAGWSPNSCGFTTSGAEKVFSFTPTVTGMHTLQVTATDVTFIDYFFKEASGGCSSTGWACIDDISSPTSTSFGPLTAGTTYLILLDDESTTASASTFQINCPASCPALTTAPPNVTISNSSCGSGCTLTGGSITAPTGAPCPAGSTLQYQVNGGSWSTMVPVYNQSSAVLNIRTRCACDNDGNNVSAESSPVSTIPGTLANPIVPANGASMVACPALATQPTPPVVMACDGSPITPSGPAVTNNPNPITCEGTRTYTWTYSCGSTSSTWSYVYTIERNPFTVPANGSATVNSPALATQPSAPVVLSNCGEVLTPTGPVETNNPNPIICTGMRTYTWTYTDCEGNVQTWSFIYTITEGNLPCGWSAETNGVGCNAGNNFTYNFTTKVFTATSTNCYYPNSFTSDALAFAQYDLCGNGSITAQVTGISPIGQGWAGVTMRESNAAGAKKAQLMTNLSDLSRREFRTTTNGAAYPQQFPSQNRYWLRITRTGNQFVMYVSPNGTTWYPAGAQTISMNSCLEVGLVVTNYVPNSTVTATFANVTVTGNMLTRPVINTVEDQLADVDFSIVPNPTNGWIAIDLSAYQQRKVQMELYNIQGKLLRTLHVERNQGKEEVDLTAFASGMYLIRVRAEGLPDMTKRVVVKSNQ